MSLYVNKEKSMGSEIGTESKGATIPKDVKSRLDEILQNGMEIMGRVFHSSGEGYSRFFKVDLGEVDSDDFSDYDDNHSGGIEDVLMWLNEFKAVLFREIKEEILMVHRQTIEASSHNCSLAIEVLAKQFDVDISEEEVRRRPNKANMELLQEEAVFLVKDLLQEERQKWLDARDLYISEVEKMELEIQTLKNGNAELNRIIGEQAKTIEVMMLNERKLANERFEPLANEGLKTIGCIASNNTDNSGD